MLHHHAAAPVPPPPPLHDDDDYDDDDDDHRGATTSYTIPLPGNSSRHGIPADDCCALVLDGMLSRAECAALRLRCDATPARYVKTATRLLPDGVTTVSVPIQRPRGYALAVFPADDLMAALWRRLLDTPVSRAALDRFTRRERGRECCGPPLGLNPRARVLRYAAPQDPATANGATAAFTMTPNGGNDATEDGDHGGGGAGLVGGSSGTGKPDQFEPHYDQIVEEANGTRSLITILVFLNDGGSANDSFTATATTTSSSSSSTTTTTTTTSTTATTSPGDEEQDGTAASDRTRRGQLDFRGGETAFLDATNEALDPVLVTPREGRMVLFEHSLWHAGRPLRPRSEKADDDDDDDDCNRKGAGLEHDARHSKYIMRTDVMFETPPKEEEEEEGTRGQTLAAPPIEVVSAPSAPVASPSFSSSSSEEEAKSMVTLLREVFAIDGGDDDAAGETRASVERLRRRYEMALETCGLLDMTVAAFRVPGRAAAEDILKESLSAITVDGDGDGDGDGDDRILSSVLAAAFGEETNVESKIPRPPNATRHHRGREEGRRPSMPSIGEDEAVEDESAALTSGSLQPMDDPDDMLQQLFAQSKVEYEERMEKMKAADEGDDDDTQGDESNDGTEAEDDSIGAGAMDFLSGFDDSEDEQEDEESDRLELGPGASLADYLDALEARNQLLRS